MFVDIFQQEIPDKSMIKAVVTNVQKPVVGICCFLTSLCAFERSFGLLTTDSQEIFSFLRR